MVGRLEEIERENIIAVKARIGDTLVAYLVECEIRSSREEQQVTVVMRYNLAGLALARCC